MRSRRRMKRIAGGSSGGGKVLWCIGLTATVLCAQETDTSTSSEHIVVGAKEWPTELVRSAYEKVWMRYVSLPPLSKIVNADTVRAIRIDGEVVGLASGRRAIIRSGAKTYAVMLRGAAMPAVGTKVRLMAVRAGAEQFSYERSTDTRVSIPHYVDVTMSYEDFVRHLRRGGHFPEAPELRTKPHRIGLFQLGRGDRNKVEGLIREREEAEKASPALSAPK